MFRFLHSVRLLPLFLLFWLCLVTGFSLKAQVGIGVTVPDANAMLDISSASRSLLLPRIAGPADPTTTVGVNGYMYYNIALNQIRVFQSGSWGPLSAAAGANTTLSNITTTSIPAGVNIQFTADNNNNIAAPANGLSNLYLSNAATGILGRGIFIGGSRILSADPSNSNLLLAGGNAGPMSNANTVVGFGAGQALTTGGASNTFIGSLAGSAVTNGGSNLVVGSNAGLTLIGGSNNTLVGPGATTTSANISSGVAVGINTLTENSAVAVGASAHASGFASLALGAGAQATANNSASILAGTNNTAGLIAIGTAINNTSFAGRVGIGTTAPNASAILDVSYSVEATGGLLLPRLNEGQRLAITSPADGLIVYQTDNTIGIWSRINGAWQGPGGGGLATDMNNLAGSGIVQNLNFAQNVNRTIGILQSPANTAGADLTIAGANAGTGTAARGGDITLRIGNGTNNTVRPGSVIITTDGSTSVNTPTYNLLDINPQVTVGGSNLMSIARISGNGGSSTGAVIRGLDVDLNGAGFALATRYAATFQGGSVGIGTTTPNASALLDLTSNSRGLLLPRMTESERTGIVGPADGLIVYQSNNTVGI